jgi:hypothetical protein
MIVAWICFAAVVESARHIRRALAASDRKASCHPEMHGKPETALYFRDDIFGAPRESANPAPLEAAREVGVEGKT